MLIFQLNNFCNKFFLKNQEEERKKLTRIFKRKFKNNRSIDSIFSHRIRLAMFKISNLTENIFSDRVACHLFLELFLLYHSTNTFDERNTIRWICKYYPGKLDTQQIQEIHQIVLRYSSRHYGCFCC